jgi:hypothetical protein
MTMPPRWRWQRHLVSLAQACNWTSVNCSQMCLQVDSTFDALDVRGWRDLQQRRAIGPLGKSNHVFIMIPDVHC